MMTPRRSTQALALALLVSAASSAQAQEKDAVVEEREVELLVGEQMVVPAEGVKKYSVPPNEIIDVRLPEDGDFVVVAVKPGTATLLLLLEGGQEVRYVFQVRSDTVEKRDNIRLDFYFVELSRRTGYRAGIGWPGTVGGTASIQATQDLVAGQTAATASVVATALPRIDLAQESGWARLYRRASVIMANGEKGSFGSGGEVNFRLEGAVSNSVQAITHGSRIKVLPRYDRSTGRIEVSVEASVTELTEPSADGLPGRTITELETLVNLELGQAIVLAGIDARNRSRGSSGLPLLSQLPVVGYLFGTKSAASQRTESLIFIVPTVIEAYTPSERGLVDEALENYRSFDGDFPKGGTL